MEKLEEENDLKSLIKWATRVGISDYDSATTSSSSCLGHSLLISTFPNAGGRGLGATRNLKKGEALLKVPREALLTSDSVMRDKKIAICVKNHPLLSSIQILAVCLLAEVGKGRASRWYPYLVHLPHTYHTLANFSQFESRALQVEDAIWVAEKAISRSKSDWKMALPLMGELQFKSQLLTINAWLWASATISSRTLHISWDDAGCLCPIGDLFNYAAPDEVTDTEDKDSIDNNSHRLTDGGYEEASASYCFYAREKYKSGDQVLLSYGTYTNIELLEHYGFLLDINPNDKLFIELDIDMHKLCSWPKGYLYIQANGIPSFSLLCTLRLWATPSNQRKSFGYHAYSGSVLSPKNELQVMKWLTNYCTNIIAKLPTTIENDVALLVNIDNLLDDSPHLKWKALFASLEEELVSFFEVNGLEKEKLEGLSVKAKTSLERLKLAVQWRYSYKRIILNCISYCNSVIDEIVAV